MSWFADLLGPWRGFAVTFRQMFKPKVTTRYPKEKRVKPQRFHGRHVLNRYPDGMEKCIGCELCAGCLPARCIYVRGADNPPDDPVSPGERFGFVYEINMLRCIFCAMCVEACPTEAITMTHLFEMSVTDRDEGIFAKDSLLVESDGTPNHPLPCDTAHRHKRVEARRRLDAGNVTVGPRSLRRHRRGPERPNGRACPGRAGPRKPPANSCQCSAGRGGHRA